MSLSDFDLPGETLIDHKFADAFGVVFLIVSTFLVAIVGMPEVLGNSILEITSTSIVNLIIVVIAVIAQYSPGIVVLVLLGLIALLGYSEYRSWRVRDNLKYTVAAEHLKYQDYSFNAFEEEYEDRNDIIDNNNAHRKRYTIPDKFRSVSELKLEKSSRKFAGLLPALRKVKRDESSDLSYVNIYFEPEKMAAEQDDSSYISNVLSALDFGKQPISPSSGADLLGRRRGIAIISNVAGAPPVSPTSFPEQPPLSATGVYGARRSLDYKVDRDLMVLDTEDTSIERSTDFEDLTLTLTVEKKGAARVFMPSLRRRIRQRSASSLRSNGYDDDEEEEDNNNDVDDDEQDEEEMELEMKRSAAKFNDIDESFRTFTDGVKIKSRYK